MTIVQSAIFLALNMYNEKSPDSSAYPDKWYNAVSRSIFIGRKISFLFANFGDCTGLWSYHKLVFQDRRWQLCEKRWNKLQQNLQNLYRPVGLKFKLRGEHV